jgi:hypothetical protein
MPETARRNRALQGQLDLLELVKTDLVDSSSQVVAADRVLDDLQRGLDRDINRARRHLRRANAHQARGFRRLELVTTPAPWDGRTERRRHDRRERVAA